MYQTHHRVQAAQRSSHSQTGKAHLGNGRVNDALLAEPVQQALGDLVGAVVLRNLLAQDKDLGVALQLLGQRLVQGISHGVLLDARALGVGSVLRRAAKVDGAGNGLCEGGRSLSGDGGSSCRDSQAGCGSEESGHGGKRKMLAGSSFFFAFLLVDGLYHKRAVLCCSREGIKQKKGRGRGEVRFGGIEREGVLRSAFGVLGISFSEGISGAGAKKFPSLGVLAANWSTQLVFFCAGAKACS